MCSAQCWLGPMVVELTKELYGLVKEDSRIGFEPSCQYFHLPLDLVEKVVNCRWILENM